MLVVEVIQMAAVAYCPPRPEQRSMVRELEDGSTGVGSPSILVLCPSTEDQATTSFALKCYTTSILLSQLSCPWLHFAWAASSLPCRLSCSASTSCSICHLLLTRLDWPFSTIWVCISGSAPLHQNPRSNSASKKGLSASFLEVLFF